MPVTSSSISFIPPKIIFFRRLLRILDQARVLLESGDARLQVFGPVPAVLERKGGRYRFQLLIQTSQRARLASALPQWLQQLEAAPLAGKVRWSLDVDPQDML